MFTKPTATIYADMSPPEWVFVSIVFAASVGWLLFGFTTVCYVVWRGGIPTNRGEWFTMLIAFGLPYRVWVCTRKLDNDE